MMGIGGIAKVAKYIFASTTDAAALLTSPFTFWQTFALLGLKELKNISGAIKKFSDETKLRLDLLELADKPTEMEKRIKKSEIFLNESVYLQQYLDITQNI